MNEISVTASDIAVYSAKVEHFVTVLSLCAFQKNKFPFHLITKPVVDFLSTLFPAK